MLRVSKSEYLFDPLQRLRSPSIVYRLVRYRKLSLFAIPFAQIRTRVRSVAGMWHTNMPPSPDTVTSRGIRSTDRWIVSTWIWHMPQRSKPPRPDAQTNFLYLLKETTIIILQHTLVVRLWKWNMFTYSW